MKLLTTLFLLGSSNAHRWQASDSCGYIVGGSHNHVARAVRELDCSNYMRTTVTPSYIASGLVTITTVVLNEITYTEASTNIVYVTARDLKPRDAFIVTVTGDAVTLTTTLEAITSTTTETIPPYATSACPNHNAYVEACRNHLSVVVATVTITASTSYITEHATVNLPGTSFEGSTSIPASNIVETISVIPSTDVQGTTSSTSLSSSVGVDPTSANVIAPSLSSSSSSFELLSSVQSAGTSINLSSSPSATTNANTDASTSSTIIAPSNFSSSPTSSVGSLSSGSSSQVTVTLNLLSTTFAPDSSLSQSTSTISLSKSFTSSTESFFVSSFILPSTFSTISSSNFLVSSVHEPYTTPLSSTTTASSNLISGTISTSLFLPSLTSTTLSTISSSTISSSSVPVLSSSSTTSLTSLSSTFSTITSQYVTNSSLTSTSLPISSTSPIPRPPVSPLIATCNVPSACRQNQYCSSDNTCLCQPTVSGTGYCMADTPCAALSSCTIDSDCGIGSACMITCCSTNKCLSLQALCQNPNTAIVIFRRDEEGSSGHRMVGKVGDEEGEGEWTNRGPWVKRLGKM
ncbi:hypothetical protein BCIN_04g05530 [Botrytis cinerea B05.10]|uniref:Uncharacterized protein n=1 Tax=Botryotinia fuckeliana (strain B05.10) TaxID=332648 RepID=A0A384JG04_BOTFB|nr:hypothetical protein BCIN_04g05530 [Botrytis cinerea B05.10]ATZ49400.1 hypothetical protein BCIN_04g05530 [Botrytis cinerea B05.10]